MESSYEQGDSAFSQKGSGLFGLSIDLTTKSHLAETAKWARFLAIVGMVFMSLAVVAILFFVFYFNTLVGSTGNIDYGGSNPFYSAGFGLGIAIVYIALMAIWFLPLLFLLRFANNMKRALAGDDQPALNRSFQQLKICLRFIGILTIIILSLYAIVFLAAGIGAAVFM